MYVCVLQLRLQLSAWEEKNHDRVVEEEYFNTY